MLEVTVGPVLSWDLLFLASTMRMQVTLGSTGTGSWGQLFTCQEEGRGQVVVAHPPLSLGWFSSFSSVTGGHWSQ